ncbi:aspartic protease 2B, partial [Aphelenchoides avenae]
VLVGLTMVTDGLAKVAGAKKDKYSMYEIACNATVPSLFLTLSGQRFDIPASELIGPIEAAEPDINIFNVYGDDRGPGKFFVGAALGKKYCLVFDYDNVQLGFSTNLYSAPVNG